MSSILYLSLSSLLFNIFLFNDVLGDWAWQISNLDFGPGNVLETWGTFVGTAPACAGHASDCQTGNIGGYCWYEVSSGDGAICTTGNKVYCNHYESPYSTLDWKGTAPSCSGSCNDCNYGDTCVALDNSGDGSLCWTGHKALCVTYIPGIGKPNITKSLQQVKGIEMGFYLYLENEFEDDQLFEKNKDLLDKIVLSVADVLTNTNGELGNVREYGYVRGVSGKYDKKYEPLFKDAKLIPFFNIQFKYTSHLDAIKIQKYLQNPKNEKIINEMSKMALSKYLKNNQKYIDLMNLDFEIHFVESNYIYSQLQDNQVGSLILNNYELNTNEHALWVAIVVLVIMIGFILNRYYKKNDDDKLLSKENTPLLMTIHN